MVSLHLEAGWSETFFQIVNPRRSQKLRIRGNNLNDKGVEDIVQVIWKCPTLQVFDLTDNKLTDIEALFELVS